MRYITGGTNLIDIELILKKSQITAGMTVADFGCGSTGHLVFPLASIVGIGGRVYAVDILKNILETINRKARQENLGTIKTIWSDIEVFGATDIEQNSLDVCFLINTLYITRKKNEVIRELARLLKKGGRIIFVEWKNSFSPFGPPNESRVNIELIKDLASNNSLKFEEEFFVGQYHYGLIFEK